MTSLSDRVEAATGADRDLDEDVFKALGWWKIPNPTFAGGLVGRWRHSDGRVTGHGGAPDYTSDLKDAMSLVPEGWHTHLAMEDRHSHSWLWHLRGGFGVNEKARACSPALALTAASLRARGL